MDALPNVPDQADALERVDNGQRLALSMQRELMAIAEAPAETLDPDAVQAVGADLGEARSRVISAAANVPLAAAPELHRRLNELVDEIDYIGLVLAERYGS